LFLSSHDETFNGPQTHSTLFVHRPSRARSSVSFVGIEMDEDYLKEAVGRTRAAAGLKSKTRPA
jgi:hypothetical protein